MLGKLILLFTLLPVAELYLLIKSGELIGAWSTISLVLFTGIVGAALAKIEGFRTLQRIKENLRANIIPTEELLDGVLIFIAGAMLLTPGFITDLWGFLILFPLSRRFLKQWLRNQFNRYLSIR